MAQQAEPAPYRAEIHRHTPRPSHRPATVRQRCAADQRPVAELSNGGIPGKHTAGTSEPRQPGGCKLKTAPVRPVVAARPAEYVCSEDLFY
ncbi:hypothetical protein FD844_23985 [Escherichia coli]|nr:hypothetical protein [Escherichia coli]